MCTSFERVPKTVKRLSCTPHMRRVFLEKKRNVQEPPSTSLLSISFARTPAGLQGGREACLDHEALQEAHLLQLLPHHADGCSEARPVLCL